MHIIGAFLVLNKSWPYNEYTDKIPQSYDVIHLAEKLASVVLLLPAIQYSGHAPAVPLDWRGGARLGFVMAPQADPKVRAYAEYIKEHLTAIPNFWEPLTE